LRKYLIHLQTKSSFPDYLVIGSNLPFCLSASDALLLKSPAWFGGCVEPGPDAMPVCVWPAHVAANALTVTMSSDSSFSTFSLSLPIHVLGLR
jgi:hypothetical protein